MSLSCSGKVDCQGWTAAAGLQACRNGRGTSSAIFLDWRAGSWSRLQVGKSQEQVQAGNLYLPLIRESIFDTFVSVCRAKHAAVPSLSCSCYEAAAAASGASWWHQPGAAATEVLVAPKHRRRHLPSSPV